MNDGTNSAKRLLRWINGIAEKDPSTLMTEAWSRVFNLEWNRSTPDIHSIQMRLTALREELDLLESHMKSSPYTEDLYLPYIRNVRNILSPANLEVLLNQHKGFVGPDTILALKWCAAVLKSEPIIPNQELEEILNRVNTLRSEIIGLDLSVVVRDFISRQLDTVEKAIQEYPVKGGEAVRHGFRDVFAVYANTVNDPLTESEKDTVSEVNEIIAFFGEISAEVIKSDKTATVAAYMAKTGQDLHTALLQTNSNRPLIEG